MKLGDHVRAMVSGEYRHGIDCGDRTVLFLARDASGRPEVRRVLAAEFAAGAGLEVVVHREPVLAPRVVVARAFSRMRDPSAAAAFGTSEDFAAWCLTGRPPEPGYAPSPVPPPAASPARSAAGGTRTPRRGAGKKARPARRTGRQAAPRRNARKAAPRRAAPRGKAPARRGGARSKRRR